MKISVTQEHIDKGCSYLYDNRSCPLSLAVKDLGFFRIDFTHDPTYHHAGYKWGVTKDSDFFPFPEEAQQWHWKLLSTQRVYPFEFELEIPE